MRNLNTGGTKHGDYAHAVAEYKIGTGENLPIQCTNYCPSLWGTSSDHILHMPTQLILVNRFALIFEKSGPPGLRSSLTDFTKCFFLRARDIFLPIPFPELILVL